MDKSETVDDQSSQLEIQKIVYVLYLIGMLFPLFSLIGIIVICVFKGDDLEDVVEQSHSQYLIRTFFIGLLYSLIGVGVAGVLGVTIHNPFVAMLALFLFLGASAVWYLVRTIKGLRLAIKDKKVPNSKTWLF